MRRLIVTLFRAVRAIARGVIAVARGFAGFARRQVGSAREKGGGGETGMMRLLDLHAASCAGDTLVAIGLAGTIFFNVPIDQARGQVALYLLITMAPFALLAPLVGPVLDRVRHGRRYALAATMLGRAFLVWIASDNLDGLGLYPAAFGILLLSRSYGVARSAALPRLLPERLTLVEAGARASLYGTVAGAVVLPLGLLAIWFGPEWTLRAAAVVFLVGMVWALRLPPRTDSQPPETVPRLFQLPGRRTARVLTGRLVWASLLGSAALRFCYGFLTLYLAFRARAGDFPITGRLPQQLALGVVAAALAIGTFAATAAFARRSIHRPLRVQTAALAATFTVAVGAAGVYNLGSVAALCVVTAAAAGAAKLAGDAVIQERVRPEFRASAFAHSETLLILAWVAGGGLGLVPFNGPLGIAVMAIAVLAATIKTAVSARGLRGERLTGSDPHLLDEAPVTESGAETVGTEAPTVSTPEPFATDGENDAPAGYHLYRPGKRSRAEDYPDNP
ncbi:MFS transporter [Phytomonospora sp. NPDC050363]|uniref:MFS transporter n=1 Tax=Phytomonospora sp. NPDC050363 TaxID=3155642 RepID=UPI003411BFB4